MPKYTPQELSRMKADKDARDAHEAMMRKRQQEIHLHHQMLQRAQPGQAGVSPYIHLYPCGL